LTSPPEKPNLHMPGARRQAISTAFATRPSSPRSGYKTTPRALACSSQRWVSCQSANWASFQPALTSSSMCPPLGSDETIMAYEMPLGGCIHRISSDLSRGRRSCTMPGDTIARGLRKPRPAATYPTGLVPRRDAGAVERGGLENRCGCKPTEGSNPSPSATCPHESVLPIRLRPDFSVVFEGYAGGAVNRPCCQEAPKWSLRADILRTC
jgi:hypothetical protein